MLELELFVVFATSLAFTFASIPLILRFAGTYGLYDYPDFNPVESSAAASRRVHTRPVPRLGGLGLILGFFLSMIIWVSPLPLKSIYFSSILMFTVGIIDDLRPLSAKIRLFLQILIAAFTVWYSNLGISTVSLTSEIYFEIPKAAAIILSTFIIVGAVNAINLTDGLDGLAGGIVLIGIALLSMLHFLVTKDINLILCFSMPLAGSLLGFLKYNTHPASIFMGDGGSNWLGFMVGILLVLVLNGSVVQGFERNYELIHYPGPVLFLSVLMCLAVPIADTGFVIFKRLRAGKSPLEADQNHFHHTLMGLGLSHPQSVSAIYFLATAIGTMGLMPIAYPTYTLWWTPLLGCVFLLLLMTFSLNLEGGYVKRFLEARELVSTKNSYGQGIHKIIKSLQTVNRYLIYAITAIMPLLAGVPHITIGFAAFAAITLIGIGLFSKDRAGFYQTFAISIGATILLTAINFNTLSVEFLNRRYNIHFLYNALFITLFTTTAAYLLLTIKRKDLIISPIDFLMLTLPFFLLFIPEPYQSEFRLNIISLRSLVLFIAIRALTRNQKRSLRRIRLVCLVGLVYVACVSIGKLKITY